jgi:hypothetical protein
VLEHLDGVWLMQRFLRVVFGVSLAAVKVLLYVIIPLTLQSYCSCSSKSSADCDLLVFICPFRPEVCAQEVRQAAAFSEQVAMTLENVSFLQTWS